MAADLTSSLTDPQINLSKALIKRDIVEFRSALKIGASALAKDEQNLSIFEKCLQTSGCGTFVKECLLAGCDPNYLNNFYDKAAINFASDSRDPRNLRELLSSPGVDVDYRYADLTALNSLAKNLNNENAADVKECMQILLGYGASPNIPDQREMTPLHTVIKNRKINDQQKYEFVQMFLNLSDIDIDTYREGELRRTLETEYPLMELPRPQKHRITNYHSLLSAVRSDNMTLFQQLYRDNPLNLNKDEQLQLLVACIQMGAHVAFDLVFAENVDYNKTLKHHTTAAEIACSYGNWYALERLLQLPDIKINQNGSSLINIVCKLNEPTLQNFCNYWKCFYVLLDSDKIDINATDFSKSTALHYAVRYQNNKAVKELLRRGACINIKNKFNDLPLNGMCPTVLEQHLDDCITSSDNKFGDKSYEINISFKNFLTSQQKHKKQLKEVLNPIAFMANSKEYRYLLQHPVITSILYLKWHKLSSIFYVNFLYFVFFAVSVIMSVVFRLRVKNPENMQNYELCEKIFSYCSYVGLGYFIAREFVQFCVAPLKYLKSVTNYLEILLIILVLLTCGIFQIDEDLQKNIAVACILLLAYELFLLVGSLPVSSISTHMLMLEAVCKSFVKSFLLYSIFIFTFALCFYIKIGDHKSAAAAAADGEAFHSFSQPLGALSKTIVMFTGEFDAGSLNLDSVHTKLLFLSFVFFMTIILFNLLNGLAVSDTQAIKDQAELNEIICRTSLLHHYEKVVFNQTHNFSFILKRQPFRLLCKIFKKLYPDYTTDIQISILPNNNNRILSSKKFKDITVTKDKDIERNTTEPLSGDDNESDILLKYKLISCWFSCFTKRCTKIDERTVTQAMSILQRKSTPSIENRLDCLEAKLNQLLANFGLNDTADAAPYTHLIK